MVKQRLIGLLRQIMIFGDEKLSKNQKDNDHVQMDGMCQQFLNGMM
jgi:hypothetical protein